jgi:hypothetical protein
MKRLIISILILLALGFALTNCASSRKSGSGLKSLMLQDNKKLGRNKVFYSKHNVKTKRDAYRKYRRNRR